MTRIEAARRRAAGAKQIAAAAAAVGFLVTLYIGLAAVVAGLTASRFAGPAPASAPIR